MRPWWWFVALVAERAATELRANEGATEFRGLPLRPGGLDPKAAPGGPLGAGDVGARARALAPWDCTFGYCSGYGGGAPASVNSSGCGECVEAYEAWNGTGACPAAPVYAPGVGADLAARRYYDPVPLKSGCPVSVVLEPGSTFYMTLDGFDAASPPKLLVEWDLEPSPPFVIFFSYRGFEYRDWYLWSTSSGSSVRYAARPDGRDVYHCAGSSCGAEDLRHGGTLHATLVTAFNVRPTRFSLTLSRLTSHGTIQSADLAAMKSLWTSNCLPYLAPEGWSWPVYVNTDHPYELGERDSRDKPYCDWWTAMTEADLEDVASCDEIPGVDCDEDGFVRDVVLDDAGLRGEMPAAFVLPRAEVVLLANNRLSGAMPAFFYDSDAVEELRVGNNAFEGEVRCPPSPRPTFRVFDAERNALDGPLPDCFFESYPNLQRLQLGANALTGPLPSTVGDAKKLVTLDIPKAGLTGPLPPELAEATALASIYLSHNYLDGTLDGSLLNAFPHLYLFDASYNAFTGPLPQVSCCIPHLRHLILSQNRFTGSVDEDTFLSFALHQTSAATSELSIAYNALSGRIPRIFKAFFYGADARLSAVDVTSNYFRCGRARSAYFEDWAHFMNYDVGMCAPVPRPRAVVGARFYPGAMIDVQGANFLATDEAKCLFLDAPSGAAWVSPAAYRSRTAVSCALASGQQKGAKIPTSKAPISVVFHSFRLIFPRAIISRSNLERGRLSLERARAEHRR